jgi:hypothetical protein
MSPFPLLGKDIPSKQQVIDNTYTEEQVDILRRLFEVHGMDLLPPSEETLKALRSGG